MKKFFLNIVLCGFITGSLKAVPDQLQTESFVSRDSVNLRSGDNYNHEFENVIIFNDSDLAPRNVRQIFNELFRQYISVKDALVYNDSYSTVRNTLKLLEDMRSKTADIEILSKDDRWVYFIKNYDSIRKKVESAKFISDQRFLFNEITNGLLIFIKQYGLYNKTVFMMQCTDPLQSGNAIWLSDSDNNKNPYLGLNNDTTFVKVKEVWKFK